jgi:hypothetical protein
MVMLHELEHLPNTLNHIQHPPQCLLLAQSGHPRVARQCPLSGVKRTSLRSATMSAFDPKRTSGLQSQASCRTSTRVRSAACESGIMWPAPSMTLRRACWTLLSTASQIARSTTDVADPSMTGAGAATDASEPAVMGALKSTSQRRRPRLCLVQPRIGWSF